MRKRGLFTAMLGLIASFQFDGMGINAPKKKDRRIC